MGFASQNYRFTFFFGTLDLGSAHLSTIFHSIASILLRINISTNLYPATRPNLDESELFYPGVCGRRGDGILRIIGVVFAEWGIFVPG